METVNNFATADISEFVSELNQPKQEFEQPHSVFDELPNEPDPEPEPQERVTTSMTKTASNAAGKLVLSVIDNAIPMGLGLIAKTEADKFKATPSERAELEEALSRYMELQGGDIPPGLMVIILVLGIYGLKVPTAIQLRKQQTVIDEQTAEIERLKKELEKRNER
jgi:hypothetical protein